MRLNRGVRLRRDAVRDRWVLLAPERGYVLNDAAAEVVRALVDGAPLPADAQDFLDALVVRRLVVRS